MTSKRFGDFSQFVQHEELYTVRNFYHFWTIFCRQKHAWKAKIRQKKDANFRRQFGSRRFEKLSNFLSDKLNVKWSVQLESFKCPSRSPIAHSKVSKMCGKIFDHHSSSNGGEKPQGHQIFPFFAWPRPSRLLLVYQGQDAAGGHDLDLWELQNDLGRGHPDHRQRGLRHRLPAVVRAMRKMYSYRRWICGKVLENKFFRILNHSCFIEPVRVVCKNTT